MRSEQTAPPAALLRDPGALVSVAGNRDQRRRLRLEALGRGWALAHGLPTPRVIAGDGEGRWLVGERIIGEVGGVSLADALDLAARIARAPAPRFHVRSSSWRTNPLTRPVRAALLPTVGVSPITFLRVRAAAASLPRAHTSHGDFHPGNLIRSDAGPVIIDWEHLGPGYLHEDTLRYLTTRPIDVSLPEVESMLLGVGGDERREIVACFRWLTLRNLVGHVAAPRTRALLDDVATLRSRWRAVDEFAAAIGGAVR